MRTANTGKTVNTPNPVDPVNTVDTTHSVTSFDGTTIGYRRVGRGPGLVMLHGSMESSSSHLQLAQELADVATVYLPDRRGRGLSGAYRAGDGLAEEVQDVQALMAATGARHLFGVSSGGVICLQTALTTPGVDKVAVFEPAMIVDGSISSKPFARVDRELAEGRVSAALVTGMLAAQMGPAVFRFVPRPVLEKLTTMAMNSEDKKASAGDVTMRMLAPNLHYDLRIVVETEGKLDDFAAITAKVLLLGGSKSPAYLRTALDALEKVLPHSERHEFAGLGHGASGNADRRGEPALVAAELRDFLTRA
jgi:pimeloyl-ACP methyl ester carboxylesterase